jgi:uncharacterized membrane protein YdbT with pleckstrin-like domain
MKQIIDFVKWFFGELFKLDTAKFIIMVIFLMFVIWIGCQFWLQEEEIKIKSSEEKVATD